MTGMLFSLMLLIVLPLATLCRTVHYVKIDEVGVKNVAKENSMEGRRENNKIIKGQYLEHQR